MEKTKKIKIMMAEDHNSARQAYVSLLNVEHNFVVTGHAANGYELLKLVEKDVPDIIITDLEMPVMNGSKLIEILKIKFPKVRVIVLSMYDEVEYISQLIISGACAYFPKKCDFSELVYTINRVFVDGYYFNDLVSKVIISSSGSAHAAMNLSPREIEILQLLCNEKSNSQIAEMLNISINTVAFHRQNIFKKTNSGSLFSLYKYAIKNGIASLE